jgi:hypothetical protein
MAAANAEIFARTKDDFDKNIPTVSSEWVSINNAIFSIGAQSGLTRKATEVMGSTA